MLTWETQGSTVQLQSSETVDGEYVDVTGTASGQAVETTGTARFFRLVETTN